MAGTCASDCIGFYKEKEEEEEKEGEEEEEEEEEEPNVFPQLFLALPGRASPRNGGGNYVLLLLLLLLLLLPPPRRPRSRRRARGQQQQKRQIYANTNEIKRCQPSVAASPPSSICTRQWQPRGQLRRARQQLNTRLHAWKIE